jgi:hypothetical protein
MRKIVFGVLMGFLLTAAQPASACFKCGFLWVMAGDEPYLIETCVAPALPCGICSPDCIIWEGICFTAGGLCRFA